MAGREPPATVHEWVVQWEIFYKSGGLFISILVYNHLGTCYHIVIKYLYIYIYIIYIHIQCVYIHTYIYIYSMYIYVCVC